MPIMHQSQSDRIVVADRPHRYEAKPRSPHTDCTACRPIVSHALRMGAHIEPPVMMTSTLDSATATPGVIVPGVLVSGVSSSMLATL